MANQVAKINGIAIASIANINGITDANLAKLNGREFTGFDGMVATGGTITTAGDSHTFEL